MLDYILQYNFDKLANTTKIDTIYKLRITVSCSSTISLVNYSKLNQLQQDEKKLTLLIAVKWSTHLTKSFKKKNLPFAYLYNFLVSLFKQIFMYHLFSSYLI